MTTKEGPAPSCAGDDGNGTQAFIQRQHPAQAPGYGADRGHGDPLLIQQPFRRPYGLFSARHSGGIKAPGCGPDTCVCSAKGAGGNAENGNHGRNDINKEGEMHGTYIRFNRAQRSGQRPGH